VNPTALHPTVTEHATNLEAVLADLTSAHEELLELVREHRRAISKGDAAVMQECLSRQGILGVRIAELDKSRARLAAEISGNPKAGIVELARALDTETAERVTAAADRLRAIITEIQKQNRIVRMATHSLVVHIDGLMQQVARALSRAGTYGRQGRVEGAGAQPCGLDMVH